MQGMPAVPGEEGTVTLQVYTSRISSRDPDKLDVTRKSGSEFGVMFAPSWAILRPTLAARTGAKERIKCGAPADHPAVLADLARAEAAWAAYVPAYLAEMRESYRCHRDVWKHMLGVERRVLVCYCADPERCHRTLLAGILSKLGAVVHGELP